jgi:serine phosphatase RsbU (regulator of sigma subunit)
MDEQVKRRDLVPQRARSRTPEPAPDAAAALAAASAASVAARGAQAQRAAELAEARRGALAYLVEAGELLAGCLDPERTLALAVQLVVPKLAVWCAIHRRDETGRDRLALVWHADENLNDALAEAVQTAPSAAGRNAPEHFTPTQPDVTHFTPDRFVSTPMFTGQRTPGQLTLEQFAADQRLSPGELLAVPLEARGRVLGTLTLATAAGLPFTPDAVELAWDLARRVALAYDSATLYADRRATAHALQSSLLPADLPTVPHADIAVVYRPAGSDAAPADLRQDDLVGGDFYDVFEIRPPGPDSGGCWGMAIGDVCGTGPQAAAVTGLARHALRLLAREGLRPAAVLDRLNRAILDEGDRGRFLTLCYLEVEPLEDGSLNLALVCAGHPSPLVLRRDGTVEAAAANQPLLGVLSEGLDFYPDSVLLAPGETLLGFTDGASERRRGPAMLEPEGLADVLRDCRGRSAAGVAARVARTVEEFGDAPLSDDMAILVLRAADRVESV